MRELPNCRFWVLKVDEVVTNLVGDYARKRVGRLEVFIAVIQAVKTVDGSVLGLSAKCLYLDEKKKLAPDCAPACTSILRSIGR